MSSSPVLQRAQQHARTEYGSGTWLEFSAVINWLLYLCSYLTFASQFPIGEMGMINVVQLCAQSKRHMQRIKYILTNKSLSFANIMNYDSKDPRAPGHWI